MRLQKKLSLSATLFCVVPLAITAILMTFIINSPTGSSLVKMEQDRLEGIRDIQKREIENYFNTIRQQLLNLSNASFTIEASQNFNAAFKSVSDESIIPYRSQVDASLKDNYNQAFMTQYKQFNTDETLPDLNQLLEGIAFNGLALQYHYIANNPHPTGSKQLLDDPLDGSSYSYFHNKYHPFFRDFLERFGFYDIFLIDAQSGNLVYSVFKEIDYATSLLNGPHKDSGIAEVFRKTLANPASNNVAIVDYSPYLPSYNAPAAFMGSPIIIDGKTEGVLIFQMPIDEINKTMTFDESWQNFGLGQSGETYLVGSDRLARSESRFLLEDKQSYLNALSSNPLIGNLIAQQIASKDTAIGLQPVLTKSVDRALEGQISFGVYQDYRGVDVLSAYAPLNIDGLNWAILADIDVEEAYASAKEFSRDILIYLLSVLLLLGVISGLIAAKLSGFISKSVVRTSEFLKIAADNHDLTSRLDINRNDEIGETAAAANSLLSSFQKILKEVEDASHQIASASEETSVITVQLNQAIQENQSQTDQVATAMTEMVSTVGEVSRNTTETSAATSEAQLQINSGTASMQSSIGLIRQLESTINTTAETVAELEKNSSIISTVLNVINDIAEQTNLLALNAAIEAARAGDQGRGFAVVASEVRNLASRTQESTSEISNMIEKLQRSAKQAVDSMDKSKTQVNQSVEQINVTGESLETIRTMINTIGDMSNQVATAAEEQSAVAEEINRNIVRINDMTTQSAEGTHQTSQASRNLAELASKLTDLVRQFKT